MPLATSQILIDRYRIAKLLGEGGFGAVYRAWDLTFEVSCAIKENTEHNEDAQRQFGHEAQILHTLRHPNLPQVKDYFEIPGKGQYLVMDFIEGQDLQQMLDESRGALPQEKVLLWMEQICDALIYLHTQEPSVIHRDIKPANIKITPQGTAVLVDFGIAKKYNPQSRTTVGARAVTPGFSPFEQYGKARTDHRTDIYALGATLYALLTGHEPIESIDRMANRELPPPRRLNPILDSEIESLTLKAMQVMPEDRYQSVAEFKAALGKTNLVAQANIQTISSQQTTKAFQYIQTTPTPTWWFDSLKALGAIVIGFYTLLTLDYMYGVDTDVIRFAQLLGAYYGFFSAVTLAGLPLQGRRRILPLLSGLISGFAALLILTIEHPIWESTYLTDYPYPFMLLGSAIVLTGVMTVIQAIQTKNWALGLLGGMSILLSANLFVVDYSYELFLSLPIGIIAMAGGALALGAAVLNRKSKNISP